MISEMREDHRTAATYSEAVEIAAKDFAAFIGKTIRPAWVASPGREDQTTPIAATFRVMPTPDDDLRHDTGSHLDPYWNLELVDDPQGEFAGLSEFWTYGPGIPLKW